MSVGFAARRIWETVNGDLDRTYGGTVPQALFDRLNTPALSNEAIIDAIFELMDAVSILAKTEDSQRPRLTGLASRIG